VAHCHLRGTRGAGSSARVSSTTAVTVTVAVGVAVVAVGVPAPALSRAGTLAGGSGLEWCRVGEGKSDAVRCVVCQHHGARAGLRWKGRHAVCVEGKVLRQTEGGSGMGSQELPCLGFKSI